jgi:LmbE family N-acetylglucosaminyl deacetylase
MLRETLVSFDGTELPHRSLKTFGPTTIVAAHPDDETLSCGGLIALLRRCKQPASVIVVGDGGSTHNEDSGFTREAHCSMRRIEVVSALHELGIMSRDVEFLGYRDESLPEHAINGFEDAVKRMRAALEPLAPETLIIPFRGDANADHSATWHIVRAAARRLETLPRFLEYPVWVGPVSDALMRERRPAIWKVDITPVLARKQRAVLTHRDLTPHLMDNFSRLYEGYFEFAD